MRGRPAVLALGLCCVTACHSALHASNAPSPADSFAFVTPDSAWFVFPAEVDTLLAWNIPGIHQYQGAPQRIWMVEIGPYVVGKILDLTVRQEWTRDTTTVPGSLDAIVRRSSVSAGRAMYSCTCVTPERDPAIRARVVNHRVQIVVYGNAAIARWLSGLQDTVEFTRLEADSSRSHGVRTVWTQKTVVRRVSR